MSLQIWPTAQTSSDYTSQMSSSISYCIDSASDDSFSNSQWFILTLQSYISHLITAAMSDEIPAFEFTLLARIHSVIAERWHHHAVKRRLEMIAQKIIAESTYKPMSRYSYNFNKFCSDILGNK